MASYALNKWDEVKALAVGADALVSSGKVALNDDQKFQLRHSIRRAVKQGGDTEISLSGCMRSGAECSTSVFTLAAARMYQR